jgi:hypothetical protein
MADTNVGREEALIQFAMINSLLEQGDFTLCRIYAYSLITQIDPFIQKGEEWAQSLLNETKDVLSMTE